MESKTLKFISNYLTLLEQGDPTADPNAQEGQAPAEDVQDVSEPAPEETMPLSSEGENEYIANLIDAALFEPSAEEANVLLNLQSVMSMKKFSNAREEVLPHVLSIIGTSTQNNRLKQDLDKVEGI